MLYFLFIFSHVHECSTYSRPCHKSDTLSTNDPDDPHKSRYSTRSATHDGTPCTDPDAYIPLPCTCRYRAMSTLLLSSPPSLLFQGWGQSVVCTAVWDAPYFPSATLHFQAIRQCNKMRAPAPHIRRKTTVTDVAAWQQAHTFSYSIHSSKRSGCSC